MQKKTDEELKLANFNALGSADINDEYRSGEDTVLWTQYGRLDDGRPARVIFEMTVQESEHQDDGPEVWDDDHVLRIEVIDEETLQLHAAGLKK